ncbi:MAG: hypothetical protein ATN35_05335 [Epulopiscium sp. Nele67-Bin004]|nr:MAG: hypothetical protein ATN35_05335 [Epulopiscium sp. Nele67-Bin004]
MDKKTVGTIPWKRLAGQAVICIFGTYIGIIFANPDDNGAYLSNTYINGINVEGWRYDTSLNIIDTFANNTLSVRYQDSILELNVQDILLAYDESVYLEQIYEMQQQYSTLTKVTKYLLGVEDKYQLPIMGNEQLIYEYITKMESIVYQDMVDATIQITDENIVITSHQNNLTLDTQSLVDTIIKNMAVYNFATIDITPFVQETEPAVTDTALQDVDTLLVSIRTAIVPDSDEAINLEIASSNINSLLVMPDEQFSYQDVLGEIGDEYLIGGGIIGGKTTLMRGGGIGQLSSTLYIAILELGLYATERYSNSTPVTYVPLGLDASFSSNLLDFRFINTLPYPIVIDAYTQDDQLVVDIYSNNSLDNVKYVLESEILEVYPIPTQYTSSFVQAASGELIDEGKEGYRVQVIRKKYVDGELESEEVISTTTYSPQPRIYNIS